MGSVAGWRCSARLYRSINDSVRSRCHTQTRRFASSTGRIDAAELLSKPLWSVRSLLPAESSKPETPITPEQLHHILRLSALPLPENKKEESKMIQVLQSQLHFVQDIQRVDTAGVEPLSSIRDDTDEGLEEVTIGVEQLRNVLQEEVAFGHRKRLRRIRKQTAETESPESWDPLQGASEKAGRYFVVHNTK